MNKRTIFLIIILFLTVVALLWSVTLPKTQKKEEPTPVVKKEQEKVVKAETILSASPSATRLVVDEPFDLKIEITSGGNTVSAAQLEIAFDPSFLEITKIRPGEFFNQPTVLLEEIDAKNGRLSYALGNRTPKQGVGTLVLITLLPKKITGTTATSFNFLPKTAVTALESLSSSVLRQATGGQFIIAP